MSDTELLDRLMAALNRNPHLMFQVWSSLRQISFYGPWETDGPDNYVLRDIEGEAIAWVDVTDSGDYEWTVGLKSGACEGLDEAQVQCEGALSTGWRRAPDELWASAVPKTLPPPKEAAVSPWTQSGDYWVRTVKGDPGILACVFLDETVWGGTIKYGVRMDTRYECPDVPPNDKLNSREFAMHAIDHILFDEGHISFTDITPG